MKTISIIEEYQIKEEEGDCRDCSCNTILEARPCFPVKMLCYPFRSLILDYKPCKLCLKKREQQNER